METKTRDSESLLYKITRPPNLETIRPTKGRAEPGPGGVPISVSARAAAMMRAQLASRRPRGLKVILTFNERVLGA